MICFSLKLFKRVLALREETGTGEQWKHFSEKEEFYKEIGAGSCDGRIYCYNREY